MQWCLLNRCMDCLLLKVQTGSAWWWDCCHSVSNHSVCWCVCQHLLWHQAETSVDSRGGGGEMDLWFCPMMLWGVLTARQWAGSAALVTLHQTVTMTAHILLLLALCFTQASSQGTTSSLYSTYTSYMDTYTVLLYRKTFLLTSVTSDILIFVTSHPYDTGVLIVYSSTFFRLFKFCPVWF